MSSIHEWVVETLLENFVLKTAEVGLADSYSLMATEGVSPVLSRAVKQLQGRRKLPQISWDRNGRNTSGAKWSMVKANQWQPSKNVFRGKTGGK
jgi:hypothetical protein